MFMAGDASKRESIALAFKQINEELRQNPDACGESREDDLRIHFVLPLGIEFQVLEDLAEVWVLRVWDCDRTN